MVNLGEKSIQMGRLKGCEHQRTKSSEISEQFLAWRHLEGKGKGEGTFQLSVMTLATHCPNMEKQLSE